MDPPAIDDDINKHGKHIEFVEGGGPLYHCNLFDTDMVHKIAQVLLPGLASACVDNTTGSLRSPGSIAVDIRKEMVDYLTQRSENFVAESVVLEDGTDAEVSEHPYDIISDFVDDFTSSKRTLFSKVSIWVLSDRREDRIDDFAQEIDINGFWLIGRRESLAQMLLKNVDFKNNFHCNMKFDSPEELAEHVPQCSFRTLNCESEGCNARLSAAQMEIHDSVCPFKILPCEQKCSDSIMRRDMDRHCITVCPMKVVNCSFYQVGCQSTVPRCMVAEHNLESLHSHILYILQGIHKEASIEDLKERVKQLIKLSSPEEVAEHRDVRSLTLIIKNLQQKLGPLEVKTKKKVSEDEESTTAPSKKEPRESPNKTEVGTESPSKSSEISNSTPKKDEKEELPELPTERQELPELPTKKEELLQSPAKAKDSPSNVEEIMQSPKKTSESSNSIPKKEELVESPTKKEEPFELPTEKDLLGSPAKKEESVVFPTEKEDLLESSPTRKELESPTKKEDLPDLPIRKEDLVEAAEIKEQSEPSAKNEVATQKEDDGGVSNR